MFQDITESLLVKTEYLVENVIETAGLTVAQIDKVLLVGGSTRMPMVSRLVERLTGRPPDQSVHPDEAVARGPSVRSPLMPRTFSETAPRWGKPQPGPLAGGLYGSRKVFARSSHPPQPTRGGLGLN